MCSGARGGWPLVCATPLETNDPARTTNAAMRAAALGTLIIARVYTQPPPSTHACLAGRRSPPPRPWPPASPRTKPRQQDRPDSYGPRDVLSEAADCGQRHGHNHAKYEASGQRDNSRDERDAHNQHNAQRYRRIRTSLDSEAVAPQPADEVRNSRKANEHGHNGQHHRERHKNEQWNANDRDAQHHYGYDHQRHKEHLRQQAGEPRPERLR